MQQELTRVTPESGSADALDRLTDLQRAQLDGILALHALRSPGEAFTVGVSIGDLTQVPLATIDATDADPQFTLRVQSRAVGTGSTPPGSAMVRQIRIGHPDATPATTRPVAPLSPARRVYRALERTAPTVLDRAREVIMGRRERAISAPLPRYPNGPENAEIAGAVADATPAAAAPEGARPAILFGLHWLQTGGAERWAIETVQMAKDQGFLPVVVTDQNSVHPWLTRPELADCVVVTTSFDGSEPPQDPDLLRAVVENFDLRGVVVHHSYWLYRALPFLRAWRPEVPVVDSLHIVEYLGGGYPGLAVRFDECIDRHHTISPELDRWLTEVQGIDPAAITMAPLTALTVDAAREFAPRTADRVFTIAYVGRLSRQKRPDVFLTLVHRLVRAGVPIRAILHGDGELAPLVTALLERYRLHDVVEQRFEDVPVAQTLADSDLLVVTSINEGLTLTTFEAVAAGVPVLSADVGSQRTIVQGPLLLPRPGGPFSRRAEAEIRRLAASESERESAWAAQRDRVAAFARHDDAHHMMKEQFAQWQG
ncbi:glycosyltransferase family 4 protein [Leucobacter tardus]|uniref:Glycosyltransferase n=1 Tax=Leucobacter tardus TaxID=501483 RepID=A0A939QF98_9MICO|nr:glycosyltransferase [Leucobacter tardus]MBO2991067.1 glycosyltransferase [Leucobacter tardus]